MYDNGGMTQPSGINPYGAIDLAALAKQREAQQRAAQSVGDEPTAASSVIEVTDLTFEQDVVQRSMVVPVVLDFWATWCEPCKQLSPILERFAEQDAGRWVLATIDVDANQQLAAAAQVQSIPTVMVVWQGQVIPGFSGALPEASVREFLNQVIGLAGEAPLPEQPEEAVDDAELDAADDALASGDFEGAAAVYRKRLAESPDDVGAKQGLARVELLQRTAGHTLEKAVPAAAAQPGDLSAQLLAADLELLAGLIQAAFDRLIDLVGLTAGDERKQVTDHLVGLLDLVGNEEPIVLDTRRRLASALF